MALTELQRPNKADFYNNLQNVASQMETAMLRWKNVAEFIGMVDSDDLDAMGVPIGQVRTDLANFRIALNDVISLYEGSAVTPVIAPGAVVDKIRFM